MFSADKNLIILAAIFELVTILMCIWPIKMLPICFPPEKPIGEKNQKWKSRPCHLFQQIHQLWQINRWFC